MMVDTDASARAGLAPRHSALKDTRSSDPAKTAAYRSSARESRRQRKRESGRNSKVRWDSLELLMGQRTLVYAALARYGALRSTDLEQIFSSDGILGLKKPDALGLVITWMSGRNRIFGLNPQFPYIEDIDRLLLAVAPEFSLDLGVSTTSRDRLFPQDAVRDNCDASMTFASRARTEALAAIEALGGTVESITHVMHALPKGTTKTRKILGKLCTAGVLRLDDDGLSFGREPWVADLRPVLRSYLRDNPDFAKRVKERSREKTAVVAKRNEYGLFAKTATERTLLALATNGPMTKGALEKRAMRRDWRGFESLLRSGIVAELPAGPNVIVGLNGLHPTAVELRDLILSVNGATEKGDFVELEYEQYNFEDIFATLPRLNVLLAVGLSDDGATDFSTMLRLYPDHSAEGILRSFSRFEDMGILTWEREKTVIRYRFRRRWPHLTPLLALIRKIGGVWPGERVNVNLAREIEPPHRRAMNVGTEP